VLQVIVDNNDNPALHVMADKPRRYPIFHRFCDRHLLMCVRTRARSIWRGESSYAAGLFTFAQL
jgi:hypothetical protein